MCVAIFCFLSGYGMYKSSCRHENIKEYIQISKKHLIGFYAQYWLVLLIFFPLGFLIGKYKFNLMTFVLSVLGLSKAYNTEWWFVKDYILFLVCFPFYMMFMLCFDRIFARIKNKQQLYAWGYLVVLAIVYILCELFCEKQIYRVLRWIPCFLSGMFAAKIEFKINIKKHKLITLAACVELLSKHRKIKEIFVAFGEKSAFMWLVHTFFSYYYFQRLTYALYFSVLIYMWLILMSFVIASILDYIYKRIVFLLHKRQ